MSVPHSQNWPSPALVGRVCPFPRIPSGNVLPPPPLRPTLRWKPSRCMARSSPITRLSRCLRAGRRVPGDGATGRPDGLTARVLPRPMIARVPITRWVVGGRRSVCTFVFKCTPESQINIWGGKTAYSYRRIPSPPSLSKVVPPPNAQRGCTHRRGKSNRQLNLVSFLGLASPLASRLPQPRPKKMDPAYQGFGGSWRKRHRAGRA